MTNEETRQPIKMCGARVRHYGGIGHEYPCKRKAVVERHGKPYCRQHDPVEGERKREAREKAAKAND